jgi:hypothetical protein
MQFYFHASLLKYPAEEGLNDKCRCFGMQHVLPIVQPH